MLGGARSGKSAVAERLAARAAGSGEVTYIATGSAAGDADMAARIAAHRDRRPPAWRTIEAGVELVPVLSSASGTVLVDSLGTWVAGHADLAVDAPALCAALRARTATTIVVSEEVGLGVHPSGEVGRRFRDVLGALNVAVADVADEVLLVVAGRALPLDRLA